MSRGKSFRQYELLELIRQDPRASIRELGARMTPPLSSTSSVWRYLNQLEVEGLVTRREGARGIYIGERPWGGVPGEKKAKRNDKAMQVLEIVRRNPSISMAELMSETGMQCSSNIWYYLHKLHRQDVLFNIADVIKRLKRESLLKKQQAAIGPHEPVRHLKAKRLSEAERIEQVAAKASREIHETASLKVLSNGVKVVCVHRPHFVVSVGA